MFQTKTYLDGKKKNIKNWSLAKLPEHQGKDHEGLIHASLVMKRQRIKGAEQLINAGDYGFISGVVWKVGDPSFFLATTSFWIEV